MDDVDDEEESSRLVRLALASQFPPVADLFISNGLLSFSLFAEDAEGVDDEVLFGEVRVPAGEADDDFEW